jgi:hypothetical protein
VNGKKSGGVRRRGFAYRVGIDQQCDKRWREVHQTILQRNQSDFSRGRRLFGRHYEALERKKLELLEKQWRRGIRRAVLEKERRSGRLDTSSSPDLGSTPQINCPPA